MKSLTVKELIEILTGCDMNAPVFINTAAGELVAITDPQVFHVHNPFTSNHSVVIDLAAEAVDAHN